MRSVTLVQYCVLLAVLSLCALAAPTSPDTAKRSFTSAGTTCYYYCPSTATVSLGTLTLVSGGSLLGLGVCYYTLGLISYTCQYSASTGAGILNNPTACPSSITTYTCGTQPDNSFRKRSATQRYVKERTPQEERIAVRQYKFKRDSEGKVSKRALESLD